MVSRQQSGLEPRNCPVCGKTFTPYRAFQRACGRNCRERMPRDESHPLAVEREFDCQRCGRRTSRITTVGAGQLRYCSDCQAEVASQSQQRKNEARRLATARDPERRIALNRAQHVRRYGITQEQYDAMFAHQGGVCFLCKNPADPNGIRAAGRLHIDHDHESGKVRALLCNHCNRGIGAFRDDPDLMRRAAAYITKHRR